MESGLSPEQKQREVFLTVLLVGLVGGGFFVFLVLITGGMFLFSIPLLGGLGLLGLYHYLFWGKTLSEETAGEREEAEMQARLEGEPWEQADPYGPRLD